MIVQGAKRNNDRREECGCGMRRVGNRDEEHRDEGFFSGVPWGVCWK